MGLPQPRTQPVETSLEGRAKNLSAPETAPRPVIIADLDAAGAFLEMGDPFPPLSQIALDFTLDQREIAVLGKVIRQRAHGVSVQFIHVPMRDEELIRRAMGPGARPSSPG